MRSSLPVPASRPTSTADDPSSRSPGHLLGRAHVSGGGIAMCRRSGWISTASSTRCLPRR
jgi:hypothetical protein